MAWVHQHFHQKRAGCGPYRFCKLCWQTEVAVDDVQLVFERGFNPSGCWAGCIKHEDGSTASMVNHIRAKHKDLLPEEMQRKRKNCIESSRVDHDLMRRFSTHMILEGLLPENVVNNARELTELGGLGTRRTFQNEVDKQIKDIKAEVRQEVEQAVSDGCRFVFSTDGGKTKTVRTKRYLAMLLSWCDLSWKRRSLCLAVRFCPGAGKADDLVAIFKEVLHEYGLT